MASSEPGHRRTASGSSTSKAANTTSSAAPVRRRSGNSRASGASLGVSGVAALPRPNSHQPAPPAASITPTWPHTPGTSSTAQHASAISVTLARPTHRLRAMPHTACATTATATTLSPWIAPVGNTAYPPARPSPNKASTSAEGSVNPSQAASAPGMPARINPSAIPTWLLAGPGRNWHSATRSA